MSTEPQGEVLGEQKMPSPADIRVDLGAKSATASIAGSPPSAAYGSEALTPLDSTRERISSVGDGEEVVGAVGGHATGATRAPDGKRRRKTSQRARLEVACVEVMKTMHENDEHALDQVIAAVRAKFGYDDKPEIFQIVLGDITKFGRAPGARKEGVTQGRPRTLYSLQSVRRSGSYDVRPTPATSEDDTPSNASQQSGQTQMVRAKKASDRPAKKRRPNGQAAAEKATTKKRKADDKARSRTSDAAADDIAHLLLGLADASPTVSEATPEAEDATGEGQPSSHHVGRWSSGGDAALENTAAAADLPAIAALARKTAEHQLARGALVAADAAATLNGSMSAPIMGSFVTLTALAAAHADHDAAAAAATAKARASVASIQRAFEAQSRALTALLTGYTQELAPLVASLCQTAEDAAAMAAEERRRRMEVEAAMDDSLRETELVKRGLERVYARLGSMHGR